MLNPFIGGFDTTTEGFDGQIIWSVAGIAVPLHQQLQKMNCLTSKKKRL